MSTLVIILCETRAHRLTGDLFMKNVIKSLNADLALLIAQNKKEEFDTIFHKNAKYIWKYEEPPDAGDLIDKLMIEDDYKENWRVLLNTGIALMGGVKSETSPKVGIAAYLYAARWILMKQLVNNDLLNKYKWFIITRSDYMWHIPHVPMTYLDPNFVYIPDGERYEGYTDRHIIVSNKHVVSATSMLDPIIHKPLWLLEHVKSRNITNIEGLLKFWLDIQGLQIKFYPYTMYTVREKDGPFSKLNVGTFNEQLGYVIKYNNEYKSYLNYKNSIHTSSDWKQYIFERSDMKTDKKCIVITTIFAPSKQILFYSVQKDWDLIIVGDSKTDDALYSNINCVYLGLSKQKELYPTLFEMVPLKSYTRKMFGYVYAIQNGYSTIYDTDDDNQILDSMEDVVSKLLIQPQIDYFGNDIKHTQLEYYDLQQIQALMKQTGAKCYTFDTRNNNLWLKSKVSEQRVHKDTVSGRIKTLFISNTQGFVNLYKIYTDADIWPRGIPPDSQNINIAPSLTECDATMSENKIAIIQGLVNNDPDVDAVYRMSHVDQSFYFEKTPIFDIVLGKGSVCPINSQNTMWTDFSLFYAMYLPVTVSFRYTDILRGYIALYQVWKMNKTVKFTAPIAPIAPIAPRNYTDSRGSVQERNVHDLQKDYESEVPMYNTATKVIELLNHNSNASILDVYSILSDHNIVQKEELAVLKEWLRLIE